MAEELTLRVITPEKMVVDTPASSVRVPATDGSMGIFPKHAAMVAALAPGMLSYTVNGTEHDLFISGGFADVRDNTLRILTAAGETPTEIDEKRAHEAEARARERLKVRGRDVSSNEGEIDLVRAEAALQRALVRLQVFGYGSKGGR